MSFGMVTTHDGGGSDAFFSRTDVFGPTSCPPAPHAPSSVRPPSRSGLLLFCVPALELLRPGTLAVSVPPCERFHYFFLRFLGCCASQFAWLCWKFDLAFHWKRGAHVVLFVGEIVVVKSMIQRILFCCHPYVNM